VGASPPLETLNHFIAIVSIPIIVNHHHHVDFIGAFFHHVM
jgi:hypothetical protein